MGIRLGVVLAASLLLLAACGDSDADAGGTTGRSVPDLDGTSWIGTFVTEGGKPRPFVTGSTLRVEFAEGAVSIDAGCNHLSGPYRLSADAELTVGPIAGTEMGCDKALMDQDAWLTGTAFAEPLVAQVGGDTLILSRPGLRLELADRGLMSPDRLLEGTAWRLDGIRAGDVVSSVPAGVDTPTFELAQDGSITVSTGCNRGRGTASVSGATMTVGPLATTRKACADRAGRETERAVLAVLDGEVAWSITEQVLTLTKGDRGLVYRASS